MTSKSKINILEFRHSTCSYLTYNYSPISEDIEFGNMKWMKIAEHPGLISSCHLFWTELGG